MAPRDSAARQAIREQTDQNMFVVAGAGSGKTSALVGRIRTLVLRDGVRLATIAAVTFTEKAGAELRDRLRAEFERSIQEGEAIKAAEQALVDLDLAAIGTLHSFAARILMLHPIEAGLPPQLTPADEIGSGIAEDEEWARVLIHLLEDETIRPALQRALISGNLDQLQHLYAKLSADWDLIDSRVLSQRERPLRVPYLATLQAAASRLQACCQACTGHDKLLDYATTALDWASGLDTDDDLQRYRTLTTASDLWNVVKPDGVYVQQGAKRNWRALAGGIDDAKAAYADLREAAIAAAGEATTIVLEHTTTWIARKVLESADERRRTGELTFHDLLVVARQVLRERSDVAEALSRRYTHLLLDEFQDTDPIQIELAVRIAGGAAGAAHADWTEITVPPGSLFVVGDPKQSIYRFRRADIGLYLGVQDWFGRTFGNDAIVELDTNFRSVPGVLDWVNQTFERLITHIPEQQPPYLGLHSYRDPLPEPPATAVTHLGWEEHDFTHDGNARTLRELEAADVAHLIAKAVAEGWPVNHRDPLSGETRVRPIRKADIAVLVPARTSLPMLKEALDGQGITYRAIAASLLYSNEDIAELLLAVQAVADRSDRFALVMTLRSSLFGLGDDDLWRWKLAGGRFSLAGFTRDDESEALRDLPVYPAMAYLRQLSLDAPRLTPADVLDRLIRDRRVLEVASDTGDASEAADRWRRLRFLVDQARAWSETAHGGIRAYLEWAKRQTSETAQVYESILPETDVDAVRILTVHAAKGLEFPMVVLSGMTALPNNQRKGISLLWTRDGYAVRAGSGFETANFSIEAPVDEQMGAEERKRLLYVAATRARDYLAVSLHRANDGQTQPRTPAELLRAVVPDDNSIASRLARGELAELPTPAGPVLSPAESEEALLARLALARQLSRQSPSQSASGLEGSDPDVVLAVEGADEEHPLTPRPLAKDQRDLDTPSYNKGRDATAIGTAVHAVLQSIDLATGSGLDGLADLHCLSGGIPQHVDQVTRLVRRALDSEAVRAAAQGEFWRESLLAMTRDDGGIVEGYADLIYRDADGGLHVVDYKTDTISSARELGERTAFYAPQLAAYAAMLGEATGQQVTAEPLFLDVRAFEAVGKTDGGEASHGNLRP